MSRHRGILSLICAICVLWLAPALAQDRGVAVIPRISAADELELGRYHALVIGNNRHLALPALRTAVADARAVAALLRDRYAFVGVELLLDASRADILLALNGYRRELEDGDRLLIYYAGHGHLDQGSGEGYWLPTDASPDNPLNWVSNSHITNTLKAMRARHVLVVADSCYSGTLTRSVGDGGDAELAATDRGRLTWLARIDAKRARTALVSGGLEPVADEGRHGHSVFAEAFLSVLRDNAELLHGQALFDRLKDRVVVNAAQTPRYGNVRFAYHEGGDFIFAPRDALRARQRPDAGNAEESQSAEHCALVWRTISDSRVRSDFEAYLAAYPECPMAPVARARLATLAPGAVADEPRSASATSSSAAATRAKAGTRFRDCDECPELVVIPAGTGVIGSPADETDRDENEGPMHDVRIGADLAVGRHEVTVAQWRACVEAGGCDGFVPEGLSAAAPDRPVAGVNWHDARAYVAWLTARTGHRYRLPSEAEWEYVARAGTRTAYHTGATIADSAAHFGGMAASPAAVGTYTANAFGLHDVHGNVWEWVEDCYQDSHMDAAGDGSARSAPDCAVRVLRGGSWREPAWSLRSAARVGFAATLRVRDFGFRVARDLVR